MLVAEYLWVTSIERIWTQDIPEGVGREEKQEGKEERIKNRKKCKRERDCFFGRNVNKNQLCFVKSKMTSVIWLTIILCIIKGKKILKPDMYILESYKYSMLRI